MPSTEENPAVYLKSLYLENFSCFKGEHTISLADKEAKPAQWTVFLGNNNTGKTSILKAIASASIEPQGNNLNKPLNKNTKYSTKYFLKNHKWNLGFFIGIELAINKNAKDVFKNKSYHIFPPINGNIENSRDYKYYGQISISSTHSFLISELPDINNTIIGFYDIYPFFKVYGYGTSRKISSNSAINSSEVSDSTIGLFSDADYLLNVEEWLLQLDYARKNNAENAENTFNKVKAILTSEILPDIRDFNFATTKDFQNFLVIETDYGWVKFRDLGYGYQTTIAWLADLAKRMFDRYPDLENPLHGPAIVLIDEIDLHLHPEWQRKIIKYLSDLFPNTQFIVTAHSPLIVQSAENVNLVMLEKDEATGSINIRQQFGSFQGWTVEEILRELMDLGEKTRSDRFLNLLKEFEESLDEGSYDKAKLAYDELDKILHPSSSQRKLLSIQLSTLVPA